MSKQSNVERVALVPVAVALWIGWVGAAGKVCGEFYPLCSGTRPWLELVLLPVMAAVLISANVLRVTPLRATALLIGSALSAYSSIPGSLSGGERVLFGCVTALSVLGMFVGWSRMAALHRVRSGDV